jgi:hypothetical protein
MFSEKPNSVSATVNPYISWPTDCNKTIKHKRALWNELILPGLVRMFTQARNNITQAMRAKCNGEKVCVIMNFY